MIFGVLLELLPYIGPVTSVLGMVTDVVAEPSAGGAMGGLVTTVIVTHKIAPWVKKFVEYSETEFDDKIFNHFMTGLGWITDVLISLGKLDADEIKGAVTKTVVDKTWE